jgi:hypothetical protein
MLQELAWEEVVIERVEIAHGLVHVPCVQKTAVWERFQVVETTLH